MMGPWGYFESFDERELREAIEAANAAMWASIGRWVKKLLIVSIVVGPVGYSAWVYFKPKLDYHLEVFQSREGERLPPMRTETIEAIEWANTGHSMWLDCLRLVREGARHPTEIDPVRLCSGMRSDWQVHLDFTRSFYMRTYEDATRKWNAYLFHSLAVAGADQQVRQYFREHAHNPSGLPVLIGG